MIKSKGERIGQVLLNFFVVLLCLCIILPFILVVSVSLSNEKDIILGGYKFIPENIDFSAYKYVFRNPKSILDAYKVTTVFSLLTMVLSLLCTSLAAWPLTRKSLKCRNKISFYFYFTMLFSGGLVPTYILYTQYLNLDDTIWVYILPALVNPWYLFMVRTFFADIPEAIIESAYIDGANEYTIFFRFVLPLSKPVLATIALFVFLGKWNDWYTSMLYINKENLVSLQYLLQRIMKNLEALQNASMMGSTIVNSADIPSETTRMAMAIVVAGPVLVIFPFFQKYFVRGMTVGSVKG